MIEREDDGIPRREAEFSVTQEDRTEKMKTSFPFLLYGICGTIMYSTYHEFVKQELQSIITTLRENSVRESLTERDIVTTLFGFIEPNRSVPRLMSLLKSCG